MMMIKHLHNSLRALFLSLSVLLSLPMLAEEIDGINYELNADTKEAAVIAKSSGKYSGNIVIPESVTYESTYYIVTGIGEGAFLNCSALTSVTIPNSVTSIGGYAFYSCSLTSLTIPNSVTSIGGCAFSYCSGLTSITIGNSVTSIGDYAFSYCSGLTSITIGNSVTSIGRCAFEYCSGLTSVTIPNSVTSIGNSAFEGCAGLTSVTIGNSVTSIRNRAFYGCSGLTSVTIGNSVKSIGGGAFGSCPSLRDVYCHAENAPSASPNEFANSNVGKATLHVPSASVDRYRAKSPWHQFGKIVALTDEETGIEELKAGNGTKASVLFDLNGRRVQKAQKGLYIQNGRKVLVK